MSHNRDKGSKEQKKKAKNSIKEKRKLKKRRSRRIRLSSLAEHQKISEVYKTSGSPTR